METIVDKKIQKRLDEIEIEKDQLSQKLTNKYFFQESSVEKKPSTITINFADFVIKKRYLKFFMNGDCYESSNKNFTNASLCNKIFA
jgi:hypothetical protein